jgi:hypothetical protein
MISAKGASPTARAEQRAERFSRRFRRRCGSTFFVVLGLALLSCAGPNATYANNVEIVGAKMNCVDRVCRFDVTLAHHDEGWDHYADSFIVVDEENNELGRRTLHHPHVNEQPFTRSLSGVKIPHGLDKIWIRAHDSVHGLSPASVELTLTK